MNDDQMGEYGITNSDIMEVTIAAWTNDILGTIGFTYFFFFFWYAFRTLSRSFLNLS